MDFFAFAQGFLHCIKHFNIQRVGHFITLDTGAIACMWPSIGFGEQGVQIKVHHVLAATIHLGEQFGAPDNLIQRSRAK